MNNPHELPNSKKNSNIFTSPSTSCSQPITQSQSQSQSQHALSTTAKINNVHDHHSIPLNKGVTTTTEHANLNLRASQVFNNSVIDFSKTPRSLEIKRGENSILRMPDRWAKAYFSRSVRCQCGGHKLTRPIPPLPAPPTIARWCSLLKSTSTICSRTFMM